MVARLEAHQDGRANVPRLKEIKLQINANKRGQISIIEKADPRSSAEIRG
jgi:hypothetical protein